MKSTRQLHDEFTGQSGAFPEMPDYPIHMRWSRICGCFPVMARRELHEGMDDFYTRVVDRGTYGELAQALSLLQLQMRYNHRLLTEKRMLTHQFDYANAGYAVWQAKIVDALRRTEPARRKKGTIIPEARHDPEPFPWLN